MPQLPNSSTEDYGADDEVKEYKQEDGEESENAPVDLVNDIKSDLIKRETENSEVRVLWGKFSGRVPLLFGRSCCMSLARSAVEIAPESLDTWAERRRGKHQRG